MSSPPPPPTPHFLILTYPAQGHINPSCCLARRLSAAGALVTISTSGHAHRLIFPELDGDGDGRIQYAPYSDGYDDTGFNWFRDKAEEFFATFRIAGKRSAGKILDDMAVRGRPVTCVIYNVIVDWAVELCRERGVSSTMYWIQPVAVLAIYHHYFRGGGYKELVDAHAADPSFVLNFPGLPAMRIGEIPGFITNTTDLNSVAVLDSIRRTLTSLEPRTKVLANTFEAVEADAIAGLAAELEVVPIGPMISAFAGDAKEVEKRRWDLNKEDNDERYMEWLERKAAKSVIYVAFGSIATMGKRQMEEMKLGLTVSRRPYLWVVRKENGSEDGEESPESEEGMVVGWCDQARVLSHTAVGCFVTHCGWNSTLEGLASGVPMVAVPQWSDQGVNARMIEEWGSGVRAIMGEQGVVTGEELKRCLEAVMGEGEEAAAVRRKTMTWEEECRMTVTEGGPSDRNLKTFVDAIRNAT